MFGLSKIMAFINLFRVGESLANSGIWKVGGMALQVALVAVLLSFNAIATAFGIPIQLSEIQAGELAAGIVTVVNIMFTFITSDKVGILPSKPTE